MKKLHSILALVMLLTLTACGGGGSDIDDISEQGVTITNRLGVEIAELKAGISDGSINGAVLAYDLGDGESTSLSMLDLCEASEGWVNIIAQDVDANLYTFMEVRLYDGVDVTLSGGDTVYAEYPYNDSIATYAGEFVPAVPFEQPEEEDRAADDCGPLVGEWVHSDEENTRILFEEDGSFSWVEESGTNVGTYACDGETVFFYFEGGGVNQSRLDPSGYLFVEGDAGSWYTRYEG